MPEATATLYNELIHIQSIWNCFNHFILPKNHGAVGEVTVVEVAVVAALSSSIHEGEALKGEVKVNAAQEK